MPALWEGLDDLISSGDLRATEEVIVELERKEDDLFEWVQARDLLSVPIDAAVQPLVTAILVTHPKLLDTRKNRSGADPFVIALAKQHGCTVVTNERATNSPERPNIPDVCNAMSIRVINVLDLIREQGWIFRR
jgi:hypothetical protein